MYCKYCGNEIADNSTYCKHCGAPIQDVMTNTIQNGAITFYREKAAVAKLVSAKIKVDGKLHGDIKEDERCTVTLPYGTHVVEIKAAMNPTATFSISINSENSTHYFPFKIDAMGKAVPSGQPKEKMPKKQSKKKPIYKRKWFWAVVVFFLIVAIGNSGSKSDTDKSSNQTKGDSVSVDAEASIIDSKFDTTEYHVLSPNVLLEYGQYMSGEKILTRLEVVNISQSYFQSHTANEESARYSFKCEFDSTTVNKQLEDGALVTVVGMVDEKSNEKTVILAACKIVPDEKYSQEADESTEIEYVTAFKVAFEEAVAAELKAERDEYAADCIDLAYNDTARNPDSHKGEKVKFSGKIIQVSEGLLDSVVYRIATKNGYENIVYVTYTRQEGESRLLENDRITVYGECNGVTSYMSLLGTITIPSVKMQYYTAQ